MPGTHSCRAPIPWLRIESLTMSDYRPRHPDTVSRYMSAIRAIGGKAEVALRSELHRRGLRFRKNVHRLPGRPDIVFTRARVTVFVDGDYWHARILRENGLDALVQRIRSPNRDYWLRKFERRVQLDDRVTSELQDAGWIVIRLWESDVIAQLPESADLIEEIVRQRQTLAG